MHVNGQVTLGENIADLGGLLVAMDAYHASLGGSPAPTIDGMTGDQRCLLGYAQVWRSKHARRCVRSKWRPDPHSPRQFRVIRRNAERRRLVESFDVIQGQKYYLKAEDRVHVW